MSTLAAFRPKNDSMAAVQTALHAVSAERQTAERHLLEARAARSAALLDPGASTNQIMALEKEIREHEVIIERLELLTPALEVKLGAAQEAAQQAAINRRVEIAAAAMNDFTSALQDYPEHARAIAAICHLGRVAQTAVLDAQRAGAMLGMSLAIDGPSFNHGSLPDLVVLPAETGMYWGRLPPRPSIYAAAL